MTVKLSLAAVAIGSVALLSGATTVQASVLSSLNNLQSRGTSNESGVEHIIVEDSSQGRLVAGSEVYSSSSGSSFDADVLGTVMDLEASGTSRNSGIR